MQFHLNSEIKTMTLPSLTAISPTATVSFVRDGYEKLLVDPQFEWLITDLRLDQPETSMGIVIRNFVAYVGKKSQSPHLARLRAEDFFKMGRAVHKNPQLRMRLVETTQKLIDDDCLSFITKPTEDAHSTLIRLLESPTNETADECLKDVSARIESMLNQQVVLFEELGKLLLEADATHKFLEKFATTQIKSVEYYNDQLNKIKDVLKRSSLPTHRGTSPAWQRINILLRSTNAPLTPDEVPTTPIKSSGFVFFNRPESSVSFVTVPTVNKKSK